MLRSLAIVALFLATPCFAEEGAGRDGAAAVRSDPFVIASDECGASRYAHLIGRDYMLERASIPDAAIIRGGARPGAIPVVDDVEQHAVQLSTLEYRSSQLNVVLDGSSRIVAVGCY